MAEKFGVILETYQVTPCQKAFLEWCKKHPHSTIKIKTSASGEPTEIITNTEDGLGTRTIPIALEIMREQKEK